MIDRGKLIGNRRSEENKTHLDIRNERVEEGEEEEKWSQEEERLVEIVLNKLLRWHSFQADADFVCVVSVGFVESVLNSYETLSVIPWWHSTVILLWIANPDSIYVPEGFRQPVCDRVEAQRDFEDVCLVVQVKDDSCEGRSIL